MSLPIHGRGASTNPPNRFIPLYRESIPGWTEEDDPAPRTRFFKDTSRTVIATNDSPDVGLHVSLNPYRGCEHGCVYCFARPFHEHLGLSAGLDFESQIFVKEDAPELLRKELISPKWVPQTVAISGVTDPYQPIERRLELTRRCLQGLRRVPQPSWDRHQERARRPRSRPPGRARPLPGGRCAHFRSRRSTRNWRARWSREPRRPRPGCGRSAN